MFVKIASATCLLILTGCTGYEPTNESEYPQSSTTVTGTVVDIEVTRYQQLIRVQPAIGPIRTLSASNVNDLFEGALVRCSHNNNWVKSCVLLQQGKRFDIKD